MSENFTWREQLKTNFKINLLFSILWANPQGVTRAQMSQISGDVEESPVWLETALSRLILLVITEHFRNCFVNSLCFIYNLAILFN